MGASLMAAMDFPNAPTIGQKYLQYTWDGEKWIVQGVGGGGGGGSAVYTSDTPPASAPDNSLWVETDTGMMFVRWNDGNSSQWVAIPGGIADAVRYATAQSLTSAQMSQARANINVTKRNYIINGGMQVSQENGGTAGTTGGYYSVDMFNIQISTTATFSYAQVSSPTPGGSANRMRLTITAADASVAAGEYTAIETRLEGQRTSDLRFGNAAAKTITIQFGVKAPAGTYSVIVLNLPSNRSYAAEYIIAAGEANTDVVKSVTVPGDVTGTWVTDNTVSHRILWSLMCGTTYSATPGVWTAANVVGSINQFNFMGTNGNVFELFDVSLTEGNAAPPFQLPDYATELALCRRYWYKTYQPTFPPGAAVAPGTGQITLAGASANQYCSGYHAFPVVMRGSPTVQTYGNNGAPASASYFTSTWNNAGLVTTNILGPSGCSFVAPTSAVAHIYNFDLVANARI